MALPNPPKLAPVGFPYWTNTKLVVLVLPTLANPATPTLAEFNAGKDVSFQLKGISGFSTSLANIDVPRVGVSFTGNIGGRGTADASMMEFYLSDKGPSDDTRSLATLQQGATGLVALCHEGIVTAATADIWPFRIGSAPVGFDLEGMKTQTVNFNIPSPPNRYIAIPTA
jgi:hypothetical protein